MGVMLKLFWLVVLAYFVNHCIKVIKITNLFVHRHNHQPGPCRLIPGIEYGSEDIQVLPNGVALISAGWATVEKNASDDLRGLYMFDFNQPDKNLTKLTMTGKLDIKNFSPHGLSLWTDPDTGIVTVFVVNHGPTTVYNESVEVFQFDDKTKSLHHLETIRDENFARLNDVVATSSKTFYATNDCIWVHENWKWFTETLLQTRFGNVVYYDGKSARLVASGFVLPNGINISPDHRTLYVILCGEAQMAVFERHNDNSITEIKRVELFMSRPDNIEVQSNGDLWISGSFSLIPSKDKMLSSMVLHAKETDREFTFSEVYVNDGTELPFSSVASYYKDHLLIGTPHLKLLYCDVRSF